jgi:hypothetical protein
MNERSQILGIELTSEESKKLDVLLSENKIQINLQEISQFRSNFEASFQKRTGNSFESSVQYALDGLKTNRKLFQALFEDDFNTYL